MKRILVLAVIVGVLCSASPLLAAFKICGSWKNDGSYCKSGTMYCKSNRTCQIITWIRGLPTFSYITEQEERPCGTCAPGGGVIGRCSVLVLYDVFIPYYRV